MIPKKYQTNIKTMAISKKPDRGSLDKAIEKGGSSANRDGAPKKGKTVQMQLRVPESTVNDINDVLSAKTPKPSRHHWIMEAIHEKLEKEKQC